MNCLLVTIFVFSIYLANAGRVNREKDLKGGVSSGPGLLRFNEKYFEGNNNWYIVYDGKENTVRIQLTKHMDSNLDFMTRQTPFEFSHMHFHLRDGKQGLKHTLNGKSYPLEAHLVHFSKKYKSLGEALRTKNTNEKSVSAIGVLFKIAPFDNPALNPIVNYLEGIKEPDEFQHIYDSEDPLNLSEFIPKKSKFFRYTGCLSSMPCEEKVLWTVFKNPIPISLKQLEQFTNLKSNLAIKQVKLFDAIIEKGPMDMPHGKDAKKKMESSVHFKISKPQKIQLKKEGNEDHLKIFEKSLPAAPQPQMELPEKVQNLDENKAQDKIILGQKKYPGVLVKNLSRDKKSIPDSDPKSLQMKLSKFNGNVVKFGPSGGLNGQIF